MMGVRRESGEMRRRLNIAKAKECCWPVGLAGCLDNKSTPEADKGVSEERRGTSAYGTFCPFVAGC